MNHFEFYLFLAGYIIAVFATVWFLHRLVIVQNLQQKDWYAVLHIFCLVMVFIAPLLFVFVVKDPDVATVLFGIFIASTVINMEHIIWHSKQVRWLRLLLTAAFIFLHFVAWFFYLMSNFGWYMD